jgi:serine/threonine protein phosphatase PrpC
MTAILKSAAGNPENQDRGIIVHTASSLIAAVADGAGGRSGGTEAAIMAIDYISRNAEKCTTPDACAQVLREVDAAISKDAVAGETTAVLVGITDTKVYGASVGDSGAWLMEPTGLTNLTQSQSRKPFIGSGASWPVPFIQTSRSPAHLLLATDGLLKYTSVDKIVEIVKREDATAAASRLIELVRYRSGALPDDVTLILASL